LLRSTRTYDPSEYEDEIKLVFMRGKGRGKGFETVGEELLTEDTDLYSVLSNRLEILHQAHCEKNRTPELLDTIEELNDALEHTQVEVNNRNKAMLQKVNDVLNELDYDEQSNLSEAVDALIGEYLDLFEEVEDEFN
jgi:hypothetical protein